MFEQTDFYETVDKCVIYLHLHEAVEAAEKERCLLYCCFYSVDKLTLSPMKFYALFLADLRSIKIFRSTRHRTSRQRDQDQAVLEELDLNVNLAENIEDTRRSS